LEDRRREQEKRRYERAGTVAAMTLNVWRDSKRRPQPFTAGDIFPWIADKREPVDDSAAVDLYFTGMAAAFRKEHPDAPAAGRRKVSKSEMVESHG